MSQANQGECASNVSPAQRRANRANSKKSTGPKTDDGKRRAARNAIRHGAFCRELLLPGEDAAALRELTVGVYQRLSPQDVMERELVDRVVAAQWKLRRMRRAERYAYGAGADRCADRDEGTYLRMTEFYGRAPHHRSAMHRAVGARATPGDPAMTGGIDVAQGLADPAGAVERIGRIEQRLEYGVYRALRELRMLREERAAKAPPPCPYLEGVDDEKDAAPPANAAPPADAPTHRVADTDPVAPATPAAADATDAQNEPNSPAPITEPALPEGYEQGSRDAHVIWPNKLVRQVAGTLRLFEKWEDPAR